MIIQNKLLKFLGYFKEKKADKLFVMKNLNKSDLSEQNKKRILTTLKNMDWLLFFFVALGTFICMEGITWLTHKYVMHGFLWYLHEDHHQPGYNSIFEKNDLFFVCIPYACVFTYFALEYLLKDKTLCQSNIPAITLVMICIISCIVFYDKKYTFTTAFGLLGTLLYTIFLRKNTNKILLSYIAILPFFFMSNGILTGSFLEEPIACGTMTTKTLESVCILSL